MKSHINERTPLLGASSHTVITIEEDASAEPVSPNAELAETVENVSNESRGSNQSCTWLGLTTVAVGALGLGLATYFNYALNCDEMLSGDRDSLNTSACTGLWAGTIASAAAVAAGLLGTVACCVRSSTPREGEEILRPTRETLMGRPTIWNVEVNRLLQRKTDLSCPQLDYTRQWTQRSKASDSPHPMPESTASTSVPQTSATDTKTEPSATKAKANPKSKSQSKDASTQTESSPSTTTKARPAASAELGVTSFCLTHTARPRSGTL